MVGVLRCHRSFLLALLMIAVMGGAAPCAAAELPQCLGIAQPPAQPGSGTLDLAASCTRRRPRGSTSNTRSHSAFRRTFRRPRV